MGDVIVELIMLPITFGVVVAGEQAIGGALSSVGISEPLASFTSAVVSGTLLLFYLAHLFTS